MKFKSILYRCTLILFLVVACFNALGQTTVVKYRLYSEKLAGTEFDPAHLKFELIFDNNKAICRFVNFMTTSQDSDPMLIGPMYDSNVIYYTDLNTKQRIANTEFAGKYCNVLLEVDYLKWNITSESRIINNFKCYKATTEYQKLDKGLNTIKTYKPVVWFTPEIPTTFGFQKLNGLPGLMIEGTINGYTFFYATNIEQNVKNIKIEKPLAPTEMTENDWENQMAAIFKNIKP